MDQGWERLARFPEGATDRGEEVAYSRERRSIAGVKSVQDMEEREPRKRALYALRLAGRRGVV